MARLWASGLLLALAAARDVKFQEVVQVDGWALGDRLAAGTRSRVIVVLKNRNMAELQGEVLAVSLPTSSRYGQHLTSSEIAALTAPAPTDRQLVQQWLASAGVQASVSLWGDRFEFEATAQELEALFHTEIRSISRGPVSTVQAGDLHVPEAVAPVLSGIFGLHGIPADRRRPVMVPEATAVTPDLLLQLYNVTGAPAVQRGGSKNKRAVVEFQGQYTSQADLDSFFQQFVHGATPGDEKYVCGVGPCEPVGREHIGTEAMLDLEYIMGPVPGIETEVWMYGGMQWCTDLKNWTTGILDHESPPLVFSISYGVQGNVSLDKTQGCSMQLVESIEDDFAKIAARGVSLIFASGDSGSGGTLVMKHKLWPVWPGSAAYSTTVGATQFISGAAGPERAVTSYGSGGGFDWRVPQQSWQKDPVEGYLAKSDAGLPGAADFNRQGRATPELAGLGLGYQVVFAKSTVSIGGTSASAPMFAGLVSLLNEVRLQAGKSPLGFLNPLIYEMGKAGRGFRDVTVGDNRKDKGGIPTSEGYSCTAGWDAVTGFGTPNFADMLKYVEGLPPGNRDVNIIV